MKLVAENAGFFVLKLAETAGKQIHAENFKNPIGSIIKMHWHAWLLNKSEFRK